MKKNFLTRLLQASLICCLSVMFTGCVEQFSMLDNPIQPTVNMNQQEVKLKVGDQYQRQAISASPATIVYSSADPAVATVNANGIVTAIAVGTTTITASVAEVDYWLPASTSYKVTVVAKYPLSTPLTLEAITAGTIVVSSPKAGMQYKKNDDAKTAMTATTTIDVAIGDKVEFYGNGTSITGYNGTKITGGTAQVKAYGNIMSMIDETGFATATTLSSTRTFCYFFQNNTTLTDVIGLLLPATTLASQCYSSMFSGCTGLTTVPSDLLPATTLAEGCYNSMFSGCTALTAAPTLPAPSLVSYCYYCMFMNCSNLSSVTCLATSGFDWYNTSWWLSYAGSAVTGTKTVYTASGSNWPSGESGIPSGWSKVEVAP